METSHRKMKTSRQCDISLTDKKARLSYMHIPDCLPSDSNNTVNALFSEEIELAGDKPVPHTTPVSASKPRTPLSCKRKLEIEVHSLSDRKSMKISTPKFKDLKTFWENKSGEQETVTKGKRIQDVVNIFEGEPNRQCQGSTSTELQSPIDTAVHSYVTKPKVFSGVKKSQKQLITDYMEIVAKSTPSPRPKDQCENLAVNEKEGVIKDGNDGKVVKDDCDYDFNELETPKVKLSLDEFRALNKEHVDRELHGENPSDNIVDDDSILMPPPVGIETSWSKTCNRVTSTELKDRERRNIACQRLFPEEDFSPEDLSPIRRQGERKMKSKRRLMSLDPNTYSQFPIPVFYSGKNSTSQLDGTQRSKRESQLNTRTQNKLDRSIESADSVPIEQTDRISTENVSNNCESYTGTTPLNDTSVWSEESTHCEQEEARQLTDSTESHISIANLSPITPHNRTPAQLSLSRTLEFSDTDLSVNQSLSFNQTDDRTGQVTMAIFNKIDEFMHVSDSSVPSNASGQINRMESDKYIVEKSSESVCDLVEHCYQSASVTDNLCAFGANSSIDDSNKFELEGKSHTEDITDSSHKQENMKLEALWKDETTSKEPLLSPQIKSPKSLASMSVESLEKTRSEYSVLKEGRIESMNHLSVPLHIQIPSETLQSSNPCMAQNTGNTTLETPESLPEEMNVTDSSSIATNCGERLTTHSDVHSKTLAEVFDPCWSPKLQRLQSMACSPTRSYLSWSPILSDTEPAQHDSDTFDQNYTNQMRQTEMSVGVDDDTETIINLIFRADQQGNIICQTLTVEDSNGGKASRDVLGSIIDKGGELWQELEKESLTAEIINVDNTQVINSLDQDPNCSQGQSTNTWPDLDPTHLQSSPVQALSGETASETEDSSFTLMLDISTSTEEESLSSISGMDQFISELFQSSDFSSSSSEAMTFPVYPQFIPSPRDLRI